MEQFDALLSDVIDSTLGLRSKTYGYQYSEIIRSLMCVFFCGGSCIEDISTHLMPHLSLHPKLKTCSAETILRAIKELTTDNITYSSPDSGKSYDFNTADTMNELLVKSLIATGEFCQEIRQLRLPVIKSLPISSTGNFTHWKEYQDSVNYLLFDTACINYGGSGKQFDWSALAQYKGKIPFLLSGGIRLSHLSKIRQFSHPQWIGVDLNSGFETAPGIKDASILHSFIHKLENHL